MLAAASRSGRPSSTSGEAEVEDVTLDRRCLLNVVLVVDPDELLLVALRARVIPCSRSGIEKQLDTASDRWWRIV